MFVTKKIPTEEKKNSTQNSFFKDKNYSEINTNDKENIIKKIINPEKDKIKNALYKLEKIGEKNKINSILETIEKNLHKIKNTQHEIKKMEATSELINSDIADITPYVHFDGVGLNVTPGRDYYEMFFDIVRRYVFLYKENLKWPPSENDFNLFKYDDKNSRELCCFYWPMYAFVKFQFHKDFNDNKVPFNDIFKLKSMRSYCEDFFIKKTDEKQKQKQKNQYSKFRYPPGMMIPPFELQKQKGGGNGEKKPENKKEQNKGKKPENKKEQNKGKNPENKETKVIVYSDAKGCNSNKLQFIKNELRETKYKLQNKIEKTEYTMLNEIVRNYIKNLKENEIIYKHGSVINLIKSIDDVNIDDYSLGEYKHKDDDCKSKKFEMNNPSCFFDPLTGSIFTYNELKAWFHKKVEGKNPNVCEILDNCYNRFKSEYPLASPMWKLQENELTGIRDRLLILIKFILRELENMYIDIQKTFEKKSQGEDKKIDQEQTSQQIEKNEENKENKMIENIRNMYNKLIYDISLETDENTKNEMIKLKKNIEMDYGDIL